MIAYQIEIVIDEEHEEQFNDIMQIVHAKLECIKGIEEVNDLPESYFEYNNDSDPFWEDDDEEVEEGCMSSKNFEKWAESIETMERYAEERREW